MFNPPVLFPASWLKIFVSVCLRSIQIQLYRNNQYALLKVEEVQADTVLILVNNYQTNKSSGLTEIKSKGEKAYSDEAYAIAKKDLKEMFDEGRIIDINRK